MWRKRGKRCSRRMSVPLCACVRGPLVCVVCGAPSSKVSGPPSRRHGCTQAGQWQWSRSLHTPYTHKSQGQPMPGDTFFLFFFFPLLAFIGDRYNIPHSSFLSQIHTQFTIMSADVLAHFSVSFCIVISFFTSRSSLFTLYFTSHIFLCIWHILQGLLAWGPQNGIQEGFLLSALPIIVRLTICLSFILCSDVSGKNKPLSYLHSPKLDRFIARQ